jgi:hypothetical protein
MRGFGFVGALAFLVLLLIAGAIGFGLGAGSAPMTAPVAGAPVVYYGHAGGFGFFGFFLFIILIFVVIGIFRRAAWGGRSGYRGWKHGYGHGWYGGRMDKDDKSGMAPWGDKPVPPFADEMLQRWHRDAHGEPEPASSSGTKPTGSDPNQPS